MASYKNKAEAQAAVTKLTADLADAKAALKKFGGGDSDNTPPQFQKKASTAPAGKSMPPWMNQSKSTPKSSKKSDFAAALAASKE